jgi:2-octaprenylphenol hydroxylase
LTARLVVGADGANSWLRNKADIPLTFWDYRHHALVATIRTEEPHGGVARQIFHNDGILAFLPLADPHLCSIVWSLVPKKPSRCMRRRRRPLTRRCAWRLITVWVCALKASAGIPANRSLRASVRGAPSGAGGGCGAYHSSAGRTGVNLGFMDAAELVEELRRLHREGKDIGQHLYLRRYERSRKHSAAMMLAGMQGFRELFAGANPAKKLLRDIGLKLADTLPALNLNSFVRRWVLTTCRTGYVLLTPVTLYFPGLCRGNSLV